MDNVNVQSLDNPFKMVLVLVLLDKLFKITHVLLVQTVKLPLMDNVNVQSLDNPYKTVLVLVLLDKSFKITNVQHVQVL